MHKKYILLLVFALLYNFIYSQFSPVSLPSLSLWLRADSGVVLSSGLVSQWSDVSGNGLHGTQVTAVNRPALSGAIPLLNNYTAVRFDGVNDFMQGGLIPGYGDSSLTVFMVAGGDSQLVGVNIAGMLSVGSSLVNGLHLIRRPNSQRYSSYSNNNILASGSNNMPNDGFVPKLWGMVKRFGVDYRLLENGTQCATSSLAGFTGTFVNTAYKIGNVGTGFYYKGSFAEMLVYTRALSDVERFQVENYLYNKYAPPVNLGPDIQETYSLCPIQLNASNRFVKYLWSTGDTTSQLSASKSGTYWVRATDVFNRISSDTIQVTLPEVLLDRPDTTICLGNTLSLGAQLTGTGYTYLWSSGAATATIAVDASSLYHVKVTDSFGCINQSDTILVTIDTFENTVSLGADTILCSGNLLSLKTPDSGWGNLTFAWSDGHTGNLLTINSPGNYNVTVTNSLGCSGVDTIGVGIKGNAPIVNFTGDTVCLGTSYITNNNSQSIDTSTIVSYTWDFGNGVQSNLVNPLYTYPLVGDYNVNLLVVTSVGCSATGARMVRIKEIPQAYFSSGIGCVQNTYLFSDQSNTSVGNPIVQWQWVFGDGTFSNTQNASHTYSVAAVYSVKLIVTSVQGCSDTVSNSINILGSAPVPYGATLNSPSNNSQQLSTDVSFSWSNDLNAVRYTLLVSSDSLFTTTQAYTNITTPSYLLNGMPGNQTYYWKVRSYNVCGDSGLSVSWNFKLFTPGNLSGLSLWLRADSGVVLSSGLVSQWSDVSGNGLHGTQVTAVNRPALSGAIPLLNNYTAVRFDGVNDFMQGGLIPGYGDSSLTVFMVAGGDSQLVGVNIAGMLSVGSSLVNGLHLIRRPNSQRYSSYSNNNILASGSNNMPNDGFVPKLWGMVKRFGVDYRLLENGTQCATSSLAGFTGTFVNTAYKIGNVGTGFYYKGSFAEMLVYTRALSDVERFQVENYLYNKYAPPVNLGPDIQETYSLCPIQLNASNRFVKYLWSTGDTTSQLSASKSGTYWVRATDVFNRISSDTIQVTLPLFGMNTVDTTVCVNSSISIYPLITNFNTFQYAWNDENLSNTYIIDPIFSGDYICTITDQNNCLIITDTVKVFIDSISLYSILPSDTVVCLGNLLGIDLGIYIPQSIQWFTGNTTSSINITTAGNYSVDITDVYGCNVKDTTTVTLKGIAPITDFIFGTSCLGDPVQFVDQSTTSMPDEVSSWLWNFGDGTTSGGASSTNVFTSSGDYTINLQVVTDSGCTGAATKNLRVNPKPVADYIYPNSSPICAGTTTALYDNSAVLITDTISQWHWTINGNQIFNTQNVAYTFTSQGNVPISLSVTTNKGCSDTLNNVIEVFAPLMPDFSFENVCQGDSVAYTDITPSYSVVSWQWNFGDGSFYSTLQNPKHKYLSSGLKNVKLIIQNAIGCINEITKPVNIVQKPTAAFTSPNTCDDILFSPQDSSISVNEPISTWIWAIQSSTYTGQTPQHLFSDTGTYSIQLIVATASGCSDTTQKSTIIHVNPVSDFTFSPLYGEAPVNISFSNLSLNADSYFWNFGDGGFSTDFEPNYTYFQNDTFDISLTAVSNYGCIDSVSKKFIAIKTDLDLSIDEVSTSQTIQPDGSVLITINAKVSNVGTRIITDVAFRATLGSGGVIQENWNGILQSGQIMDYTFSAKFVVAATNAQTYVCVEAESVNTDQIEIRTDNNRECASLTGSMQLVGPSPNPSFQQAILGIILPKAGNIEIAITDMLGHYVINPTIIQLGEGRSDYMIPINQLTAAEYLIRVKYLDDQLVRKFVVR